MPLSIKVLNISLVLLCIFITAFVCTFLAIISNEKALDDTKESRDVSVGAAFSVGEESVTNRTKEYLDVVMDSTVSFLGDFTKGHRLASVSQAKEIMAAPWDDVKHYDWHRKPRYYYGFQLLRDEGSTAVGFILRNKMMVLDYEDTATLTNEPDEYHSYHVALNYGDDHPAGGLGRTFSASTDDGFPTGVTNPLTDVNWADNATHPCVKSDVETSGARPDDPCVTFAAANPTSLPNYYISTLIPFGTSLWTPPLPVSGYLTIQCFTPVSHNGQRTGFTSSAADLRHVSKHLTSVKVGGPVNGHPSRGRVFVTLRSTWLDPTGVSYAGRMLGASHGDVIVPASGSSWEALFPVQSTDPIISTVANQTAGMGLNLTATSASGNLTVLSIETDLAPQGEDFYYKVGRLQDRYGVDWYVHLVIDREYILGTIDKRTAETRDEIKASEQKVDDDLEEARTILYVLVVVVTVALTVLSAVLVLKIIEPLVVLEKEMAAVAVMNLEAVNTDRPLSALGEVRLMQVSFLQMIRNLVEYRNYMPASVLQTDDDTEDSEEKESANHTNSKSSGSARKSMVSVSQAGVKHTLLMSGEIVTRRVTLMVCNVVGFLKIKESAKIQSIISKYLATGLQHLKATKGIPDSFSGDRLYASWNGVRVCSSHRTAAYTASIGLASATAQSESLSIGLASGQVTCGNMGCEGMKKYSYIGSLSSWVHVVERIGRSMECDVAIDAVVNEEVCNKAYTRMLQHVVFKKHTGKMINVWQAMKQKQVAEEEWMYQLEEGDSKDPNKAYNTSYELFMKGKVPEAMQALGDFEDGSRVVALYKERLAGGHSEPLEDALKYC